MWWPQPGGPAPEESGTQSPQPQGAMSLQTGSELGGLRTEGMGTLGQSCRLFLYLLPLTPSFYLLNIEICLGLDGADRGWSPRGLPSPLAQRNGCQEQGEEQHSPRGQHGSPVRDSRRQDGEVEEGTVPGQVRVHCPVPQEAQPRKSTSVFRLLSPYPKLGLS